MVKFCDKCGAQLKTENARFCDKCGAKVKFPSNTQSTANASNIPINTEEKDMVIALLISFFLSGLGMAYAGNVGKGVGYFVGSIIVYFIFGYFTYHPPRINLFYDYMNKGYGIIKSS